MKKILGKRARYAPEIIILALSSLLELTILMKYARLNEELLLYLHISIPYMMINDEVLLKSSHTCIWFPHVDNKSHFTSNTFKASLLYWEY